MGGGTEIAFKWGQKDGTDRCADELIHALPGYVTGLFSTAFRQSKRQALS
jgi:hypothetical protein